MIDRLGLATDKYGGYIVESDDGSLCNFQDAQDAVKKFLTATGNDLCHENRRELAEAFGLQDIVPAPPKDRCEFRRKCQEYEAEVYGPPDPDSPLWGEE